MGAGICATAHGILHTRKGGSSLKQATDHGEEHKVEQVFWQEYCPWYIHTGAVCSWRTAPHSTDPYWNNSWITATCGRNPTLEWRREEHQRQRYELATTFLFPICLHYSGEGEVERSRVKLTLEKMLVRERCFWFIFSSHYPALFLIDKKLIYPKLVTGKQSICPHLNPQVFFIVFSPAVLMRTGNERVVLWAPWQPAKVNWSYI